jgi:hypothetical protein
MRVSSVKTIHLDHRDLKDAIVAYLHSKGEKELATHLSKNECDIEPEIGSRGFSLAVTIDGEIWDDNKGEAKTDVLTDEWNGDIGALNTSKFPDAFPDAFDSPVLNVPPLSRIEKLKKKII